MIKGEYHLMSKVIPGSLPNSKENFYMYMENIIKLLMVGLFVSNGQFLIKNSNFAENYLAKLEKNLSYSFVLGDRNL